MTKARKQPINIHLGSGGNNIKGWINYDLDTKWGATKADLSKGIPLPDNSAERIFSEHVIEHFDKETGYKIIEESYRVLKPGGVMRIGWPGFNKLISSYLLRSKKHYNHVVPHLNLRYGHWDEIFADRLFSWDHRYAYTPKHLKNILQEVGFKDIIRQKYMQSKYGFIWDTHNDPVTEYLECKK